MDFLRTGQLHHCVFVGEEGGMFCVDIFKNRGNVLVEIKSIYKTTSFKFVRDVLIKVIAGHQL